VSISADKFMELVGTEDIGFVCHMFFDGVEYALGAISPKDSPLKAMIKSSRAMMATMCDKGLITEDEWRDTLGNPENIHAITFDKD